jgi:acylphosphatase
MAEVTVARRLIIHGRVQGVWFRAAMRRVALDAGVSGWAANSDEGTVVAVLEGPAEGVAQVVDFAHHGPERARVERVTVSEVPVEGRTGFEVR